MTEKEKNKKINELKEQWKKEISQIPDNDYGKHRNILDNSCNKVYKEISQKYIKLINQLKNSN